MDAPYPPTRPTSTEMYDYSSDSDLEDEEDIQGGAPSAHDVGAENHTDIKVRNSRGYDGGVEPERMLVGQRWRIHRHGGGCIRTCKCRYECPHQWQ